MGWNGCSHSLYLSSLVAASKKYKTIINFEHVIAGWDKCDHLKIIIASLKTGLCASF